MPGVFCGLVIDPRMPSFGQINDGNCLSMPYAKGFGWAAELNLQDCYRKLFEHERRGRRLPQGARSHHGQEPRHPPGTSGRLCRPMIEVLRAWTPDLLRVSLRGEKFQELFFANSQDAEISALPEGAAGLTGFCVGWLPPALPLLARRAVCVAPWHRDA